MSLNIKDPETQALAAEFARATGDYMTKAVTLAIQERLHRIKRHRGPSASEILAIGKRCAETLISKPIDHARLLYDKLGRPK
jgi:antitoxin VapB